VTCVLGRSTGDLCPKCRSNRTEHLVSSGSVQGSELGDGEKVDADRFRECIACGHQWIQSVERPLAS
jgi:hypothetical protein